MPGHPSADCLPTRVTDRLQSATNAQTLAYVTVIAQFLNKGIRKTWGRLFHCNGPAEGAPTLLESKRWFFKLNKERTT